MATIPVVDVTAPEYYPDSDGRPIGETPLHVQNLCYVLEPLEVWLDNDSLALVAGNMFVYYVRGNRWLHVSPDVFVVRGIPKVTTPERRRYLVWQEGKAPDLVIELTSASTSEEDMDDKMALYQDTLRVREYFLFDPYEEYLHPRLQGYRLGGREYERIEPVAGRLPSEVLALHLEGVGLLLRFYDPASRRRLPIPPEERAALLMAEAARQRAETERQQAEAERRQAEAEVERLRRELEELRRQRPGQS
jgi:Uma2 family endonuclease